MLAHGLWCHGSQPVSTAGGFPLDAIFFLEHHDQNRITLISSKEKTVFPLLSAMVKPIIEKSGWDSSFDFLEAVVRKVPCYHIQFDLSGDIVKAIQAEWSV